MDKNRFVITVSRRYGCGGRELAILLAKKLGVRLYDRQLVHIAAATLNLNLSEEELLELENTVPLSMALIPFRSFGVKLGASEYSRAMFLTESNIIRKLTEDKSCVILGRCGDYVLRDHENKFSIFVTADDDYRAKRGQTVYEGKTLQELDAENKKRARYYEYYTNQTWGDGANYDLIVNAGIAPLEKIADGIIEYMAKTRLKG